MKYYRVFGKREDGYSVPRKIGTVDTLNRGILICTEDTLLNHLGPQIFEVEPSHPFRDDCGCLRSKRVRISKETNWSPTNARLFACDCAEIVLYKFESVYSKDKTPKNFINLVRGYLRREVTAEELHNAKLKYHEFLDWVEGHDAKMAAYTAYDTDYGPFEDGWVAAVSVVCSVRWLTVYMPDTEQRMATILQKYL